jgi:hypothetical protein
MSETSEIVTPLVRAINEIPGCWALRVNSGRVAVRRGWLHLAPENTPDIIGHIRGRHFAIECKVPGEKPKPGQAAFLERAERDGCITGVATSVAEGLRLLGL